MIEEELLDTDSSCDPGWLGKNCWTRMKIWPRAVGVKRSGDSGWTDYWTFNRSGDPGRIVHGRVWLQW